MTKKGRPTKKQVAERPLTNVAMQILQHASALALLMRDPLKVSLTQSRKRLQEFVDSCGEGDVLPVSGKDADVDGCLSDVDVIQFVIEAIDLRLDNCDEDE